MEIYLIRHGETIWNSSDKVQGHMDIELNENGRELAGITGRNLEAVSFDRIFSSPLIRAYETACLIRGHKNIPIIRDDRLKEICFGINEGTSMSGMIQNKNHPAHYFFDEPEKYIPAENGETFEEVCSRAADFMKEMVEPEEKNWNRILIVAHGALNQALMCYMMKREIRDYWGGGLQGNCGVNIIERKNGKYQLIKENINFVTVQPGNNG